MNGFELYVRQTGLDQDRHVRAVAVKKKFKTAHALQNELWRWRDENSISWASSADPVLAPSKLAGLFFASASFGKKNPVNLAKQSERQGKATSQPLQAVIHGRNVIGNILNISGRDAGCLVVFEH